MPDLRINDKVKVNAFILEYIRSNGVYLCLQSADECGLVLLGLTVRVKSALVHCSFFMEPMSKVGVLSGQGVIVTAATAITSESSALTPRQSSSLEIDDYFVFFMYINM